MTPFERLDQAMNERRLKLRMNWRQLADAAGISYTAIRAIRKGEYRPTELTAQDLDRALQWVPGSVYAILGGGDPAPVEAGSIDEQQTEAHTESRTAGEAEAPETEAAPTASQELELAARLMAAQVRELGLTPEEAEEAWRRAYQRIEQSRGPASSPESHSETSSRHQAG